MYYIYSMLSSDLIDELRAIAYCEAAKPVNRVAALNSLSKEGVDTPKVRRVLHELATDINTPDAVKVRAIDLLAKLQTVEPPKDLSEAEITELEQSLMEQYVGTTQPDSRKI